MVSKKFPGFEIVEKKRRRFLRPKNRQKWLLKTSQKKSISQNQTTESSVSFGNV